MIKRIELITSIWLSVMGIVMCQDGAPYGLINKVKTECEMSSMTFGTRLSDAFNSLDESTDQDSRKHHDYLAEHLGFASTNHSGLWKQSELSADGQHIHLLQKRGGWIGHKNLTHSSYWSLEHKWVYLIGDLTQAQLWGAMVAPFHEGSELMQGEVLPYLRSDKCVKQGHRTALSTASDENHTEVTCHSSGFGANGKLSFDWKHTSFDEYDDWLWSDSGLFPASSSSSSAVRTPDIVVLQFGSHACMHAVVKGSEVNEAMIKEQEVLIPTLMDRIASAIARPREESKPNSTVIVVTASRSLNGDPRSSFCMWKLNRLIAHEAHLRGFPVFEREELEHRLFFKSEHSPEHLQLTSASMHLTPPAPQILATTLLNMISCLAINGSRALIDSNRHHHHHHAFHWGALGSDL